MKKEENGGNNSSGIASVVLGIVGSVLGVLVLPIISSIAGLVFGIIQYRKEKNVWAIWGIALSILGIIISVYVVFKITTVMSDFQQTITACQADPSLPGCSDLMKFAGVQ